MVVISSSTLSVSPKYNNNNTNNNYFKNSSSSLWRRRRTTLAILLVFVFITAISLIIFVLLFYDNGHHQLLNSYSLHQYYLYSSAAADSSRRKKEEESVLSLHYPPDHPKQQQQRQRQQQQRTTRRQQEQQQQRRRRRAVLEDARQQQQQQQQQHEEQPIKQQQPKPIQTQQQPPLNIVLLYADDWSYLTLGAMSKKKNPLIQTPYLDLMAKDGILFTHSCVTTSICMVSRATLYTGQYASRHRTMEPDSMEMYEVDAKWNETLYPLLYQNNYHVGFFGKWHHPDPPSNIPIFHSSKFYQYEHYVNRKGIIKHITEWNEIDAIEFLQKRPINQKFALTISFFATHAEDGTDAKYRPMNSSIEKWYINDTIPIPKTMSEQHWDNMPYFFHNNENFGRGRYYGRYDTPDLYQTMMKNTYRMASEVDAVCGKIINLLKEQNVLNETLIIFTTDNGNFHGQHGLAEKWFAYEESLRVPLVIYDPRMLPTLRGMKNDEFTLNIDLAPTILSAAGIQPPIQMQGRDIAQLYLNPIETAKNWRKEFFYEFYGPPHHLPSNLALVRKELKYIYWLDFDVEQFFDLMQDPYEEFDLINHTDKELLHAVKTRMWELEGLATAGVWL